jgi:hypothetical protein
MTTIEYEAKLKELGDSCQKARNDLEEANTEYCKVLAQYNAACKAAQESLIRQQMR